MRIHEFATASFARGLPTTESIGISSLLRNQPGSFWVAVRRQTFEDGSFVDSLDLQTAAWSESVCLDEVDDHDSTGLNHPIGQYVGMIQIPVALVGLRIGRDII